MLQSARLFSAAALIALWTLPAAAQSARGRCIAVSGSKIVVHAGDGTVRFGRLDGNKLVRISGISNATAVAIGDDEFIALLADGKVVGVGAGMYPSEVSGLGRVIDISALGTEFYALLADGTVRTWSTALGAAPSTSYATRVRSAAKPVPGISNATRISAGPHGLLALLNDGSVRWWSAAERRAVPIEGITNATVIAAGHDAAAALLADGTVVRWLTNPELQYAATAYQADLKPRALKGLTNAVAITERLVLLADGAVREWEDADFPTNDVRVLDNVIAIATTYARQPSPPKAAELAGFRLNAALTQNGELVTWWHEHNRPDQRRVLTNLGSQVASTCAHAPSPQLATKLSPTEASADALPAYVRAYRNWVAFNEANLSGPAGVRGVYLERLWPDISAGLVDNLKVLQHFFPRFVLPPGARYLPCTKSYVPSVILSFGSYEPEVLKRASAQRLTDQTGAERMLLATEPGTTFQRAVTFLKANGFMAVKQGLLELKDNEWWLQADPTLFFPGGHPAVERDCSIPAGPYVVLQPDSWHHNWDRKK